MVSRSLAAGNSIMPKTANIMQRVDLGVLTVGRDRRALGVGARHGRGLAGEGRDTAVEVALGEEQDAGDGQGEHQAPDEQARPVDGDRAADREHAAGSTVVVGLDVPRDQDDADQRGDEPAQRQRDLCGVAHGTREEGLDDDAQAGDAEDDQQGPELEVVDARLHELGHW